jgi:N6-adenosine-specific RNA methylase IME4
MREPVGAEFRTFDAIPRHCWRVIAADPPWRFLTRTAAGEGKSPQAHYDTMTLEQIRALPVADLAARDCVLILWAWSPMLDVAMRLLEDWRFKFVSAGAWAKRSESGRSWAFGSGYYLRGACEYFLIAKRGQPEARDKSVRNLIAPGDPDLLASECHSPDPAGGDGPLIVDRKREHSRKPDCTLAPFEQAFAGPRLELFARTARPGWSAFGNEIGKFERGGS